MQVLKRPGSSLPSDPARYFQGLTAELKSIQILNAIQCLPTIVIYSGFSISEDGSPSWSWAGVSRQVATIPELSLGDHFVHSIQRDQVRSLIRDALYASYLPQIRSSAVSQPNLAFGSISHYAHFQDKNPLTYIGLTMCISLAQKCILHRN